MKSMCAFGDPDRSWNAIGNDGGEETQCNGCTDTWGVSWQITPIALTEANTGVSPGHDERDGEIKTGDVPLDSSRQAELTRQERMQRKG